MICHGSPILNDKLMITDSQTPTELSDLPEKAVKLAAEILSASRDQETTDERNRSAMMARMMDDATGKKFTIAMADQVLRIQRPERAAQRMDGLIDEYGVAQVFLRTSIAWRLRLGNGLASWLPELVMPKVKVQSSRGFRTRHHFCGRQGVSKSTLQEREKTGIRVNFNQLGEAVLGDQEADRRLRDNIQRLLEPGVNYISIKLSAIVSQISLTGYQQTIETIKPRLRSIYQAAIDGRRREGAQIRQSRHGGIPRPAFDRRRVSRRARRTRI